MPEEKFQRAVAYKLRVGDILRGNKVLDGDRLKLVELGDKQIIRVNVVANVIEKYESEGEKKFASLTMDDASGQIHVRIFGDDTIKFKDINQGNTIMIIGVLRFFNNELYILPEIIKIKEPTYLLVRKLELEKERKEMPGTAKEEIKAIKEQIIDKIKEAEKDGGIDIDKIIMEIKSSPDIINQEIQKLLEEGLAYEPRPGRIRFLG